MEKSTTLSFFGEALALTNAVVWASMVILFKKAGTKLSPVSLNLFKIISGLVLMTVTCLIMRIPFFPDLDVRIYILMAVSGALGIGISDTLFFRCLQLLGASRTAIVDCTYSLFVILFSYLLLGEILTLTDSVGATLIISSLFLLTGEKRADRIEPRVLFTGIFIGSLAMATMAFGIVLIKPLLNDLPVVWVAMTRMFFGASSLALYSLFQPNTQKTWDVFRPQKIWEILVPACLFGSYVTMLLWIASFKFATANVAAILTQMSTVFTVLFAYLQLKEPLTKKKIVSVILAIFGSALVIVG